MRKPTPDRRTARERIAAAAEQAGWTAEPVRGAVRYSRGRSHVTVVYDALERAIDGDTVNSSRSLNLPRARTADHVLGFLYGYRGARFERVLIGGIWTVTRRQRTGGKTFVDLRADDGTRSVYDEADLHKIVARHLGGTS